MDDTTGAAFDLESSLVSGIESIDSGVQREAPMSAPAETAEASISPTEQVETTEKAERALPQATSGQDATAEEAVEEPVGVRNMRTQIESLEGELKPIKTLISDFGGQAIVESLKPVAEAFYNPQSTVDQRIQALEGIAPGAAEEILWSIASRPSTRDALISDYFNGASFEEVASAVQAMREADQSRGTAPAPDEHQAGLPLRVEDEWGNQIQLPEAVRSSFQQLTESNSKLQTRLEALEKASVRASQEAAARASRETEAQAIAAHNEFLEQIMSPVSDVIKKMGWEPIESDTPEEKELKTQAAQLLIESAPQMFEREQANKALAENALGLIPKHGKDAAARFLPELKYRMGTLAAKRAEFISRLMQSDRELRSLKVTKSLTARPEIASAAGATRAAGAGSERAKAEIQPTDPFNIDDMMREVDDRERSGWFSRFRR